MMATYKVDFYNTSSGWFHSSIEVQAVTPELAETQARNEFGPDAPYYRTGVTETVADEAGESSDSPDDDGYEEEVNANG